MGEGGEEGGQNERAHGRGDGMEIGLCARGLGGWRADCSGTMQDEVWTASDFIFGREPVLSQFVWKHACQ